MKKQTKSKKNTPIIALCVCASILVLLVLGCVALFFHYYSLMDTKEQEFDYSQVGDISDSDFIVTNTDASAIDLPNGNVIVKKGYTNILLIGTDEREREFSPTSRADSVMLMSLNNSTGAIKLVSFERGMSVRIPGRNPDILTHTFHYGGSKLLIETLQSHFNVNVDKYVRINFNMFQEVVNQIGGVDIELTEREAYGLNTPNFNTWPLTRKVSAGQNHFDGYEALQYARMRWIDSDWQRVKRQRKVIMAIKQKIGTLSVGELNDLTENCLPYVQTNLTAADCASLMLKAPKYLKSDIEQKTIPEDGTYCSLGNVDFEANSRILNDFLYE